MSIDLYNTEIAFKHKSDKDLKRAIWLFKMVNKKWVVKFGKWATPLAFKLRLPIKGIIKRTIFKQFCGGENITECKERIQELSRAGVGTILDYSLEGKESNEDLDKTTLEIIETIKIAKENKDICFAVFKPTGICTFQILEKANFGIDKLTPVELVEYQRFEKRMNEICKAAYEANVSVLVDAEDSWIQDSIDHITESMMLKYNHIKPIVVQTVQMYRHDRLNYLQYLHSKCTENKVYMGVKLVRGAYMEKERERAKIMNYQDPIQENKLATDKDYNLALKFCVQHLYNTLVCAGSHNEESAIYLTQEMKALNLSNNHPHIYFAQLLGMSDHISFNLANQGYNVAKYVPYGPLKEVMPYLIRRAEENTSVAGQTGRELNLLQNELKRRNM